MKTILNNRKQVIYEYECIHCGNCCKIPMKIQILLKDILKWKEFAFNDYLHTIQICPTTFSPRKLDEVVANQRKNLVSFILKNHQYRGEGHGFLIERPYLKQDWSSRPILSPNSTETVIKGMQLGLEYILITELTDSCPFLKSNSCSIQAIKPTLCKLFPFNKRNNLRVTNRILAVCKGFKKSVDV